MKILFVIKSLSGTGGGAERILTSIASSLARRRHDVTVLTFDKPDAPDFYPLAANVSRIRLGLGVTTTRSRPLEILQRVSGMRRCAKSLKPDVAVGFMHSSFVPLAAALCGSGIRTIACERIAYQHYNNRLLERLSVRFAYLLFDKLTINSKAAFASFPASIRRRMTMIPNPVRRAARTADPVGTARKTLLTVAALRPQKDQETLVRAFAELAPRYPDWELAIVGEGAMRVALERLIEQLGLTDRVRLLGATTSVETAYEKAQLFVLPSLYEGFPNSLAEALAHGLPSIAFASCPGTDDLIQHGINGLLASGGDRVRELARSLEDLMISPDQRVRMSAAAVESVRLYSLERVTDEWERLLLSVIPNAT